MGEALARVVPSPPRLASSACRMRWKPIAGTTPSSTQKNASTTCGSCIIQGTSRRPFFAAACDLTRALVRERKLTPKNLMNEANVRALVRMAITAHTTR